MVEEAKDYNRNGCFHFNRILLINEVETNLKKILANEIQ